LPGVFFALSNAACVSGQLRFGEAVLPGAAHEFGSEHGIQAPAPVAGAMLGEMIVGAQLLFAVGKGGGQCVDAGVAGGDGSHHGYVRRVIGGQRLEGADFLLDPVRAFAVGFVDDEDVGDLHDARLEALHVVTHAGNEHDEGDIGEARDFDFVLTDADRFDEDNVFATGFEDEASPPSEPRVAMERA